MSSDKINLELIAAIMKDLGGGGGGPSIKEMRNDPNFSGLLRDDKEMNPLKGRLVKALKAGVRSKCLAPVEPECPNDPIGSHSMQKSGALSHLADETRHVIMFEASPSFEEQPRPLAKRVGIRDASVFPGLCESHDAAIFLEIDTKPMDPPSSQQLFLLAYRSLLKEYHAMQARERATKESTKVVISDAACSDEVKVAAISHAYQTHLGCFHLESAKRIYDHILAKGEFDKFILLIWKRVKKIPFAAASLFTPVADLNGNLIPFEKDKALPFLTLDVVPDANGTLISFAVPYWHVKPLYPLLLPLAKAASDDEFIALSWEIALRNCENLAIAPTEWNRLKVEDQQVIEKFFAATLNQWAPRPDGLVVPSYS